MRSRGSLIRNIILGIAGALLGGWIVSFFADVTKFSIIGFLVAVGGACILIFIFRLLFGGKRR
ncbi:MAG: GlsB/YeaQ/YmgE family stress response membrane protein [Dehalococcoidia bacterium]|nr:GlsB/YeaQ/YmgE family stress response membrane protein [Dehalococcoidia bacterium]